MTATFMKLALALILGFLTASTASAQSQTSTNTNCNAYGSSIDCTSTSTTTQTGPTAAQVEQQRQMNENAAKTGAALGSIIAMKRAQHTEEKNELTAVTFCRQNPAGTWTFPNKTPTPCANLERNVVAYCSVNAKKSICKDVAKHPPASSQLIPSSDEQRVTINVVYCQLNPNGTVTAGNGEKQGCADEIAHVTAICTVQGWKGKPCEAISNNKATAVQAAAPQVQQEPQVNSQAQPQVTAVTTQVAKVSDTPRLPSTDAIQASPEVSVAEAARQARLAKAVREAKEKAEQDNPAPPQN
jgi:hypothetical protein